MVDKALRRTARLLLAVLFVVSIAVLWRNTFSPRETVITDRVIVDVSASDQTEVSDNKPSALSFAEYATPTPWPVSAKCPSQDIVPADPRGSPNMSGFMNAHALREDGVQCESLYTFENAFDPAPVMTFHERVDRLVGTDNCGLTFRNADDEIIVVDFQGCDVPGPWAPTGTVTLKIVRRHVEVFYQDWGYVRDFGWKIGIIVLYGEVVTPFKADPVQPWENQTVALPGG